MQYPSESAHLPEHERLQLVADWGAVAMWEIDLNSQRVTWNTRGEQFLALPEGTVPADLNELLSFVHPDDRARLNANLQRALAEKWGKNSDRLRIIRHDGRVRHVTIFTHYVYDEHGNPARMIGIAQDVTEATERDQERVDVEERLRVLHETSKSWAWQIDLATLTITRPLQTPHSASPRFGPDQRLVDWFEHVHPEDRLRVERGLQQLIADGGLWQDEFRVRWPNGEYKWIFDHAQKVERPGRDPIIAGAAMDVTERRQVEQQLIDNEERLRSAYIAGKMWPWEIEAPTLRMKRTLDGDAHYRGPQRPPTPDLNGMIETVHPEDRENFRSAILNAMRTHAPYSCTYRVKWNDGSYHSVSSRGGMMQDDRGAWRLMGVAQDLEEQKRTEEALEESERLRRLAIDAANMGVWSQDMRTGQIHWSTRQRRIFGIDETSDASHRDEFRKLVFPEDLERLDREGAALADAHARRFRFEFRIRRPKDGTVRWMAAVGEFMYDEDGKPSRMIGVNYDVTEAKQREHALRESEAFRRLALGAAHMGAWEWDFASRHLRWSEEQERLFGFEPGTFDGTLESFLARVHPEDVSPLQEYERRLLHKRGKRYETEFRIILPDGSERWIGALGEVEHDSAGKAVRIYGVNFDLTDRKRAEQALRTGEKLATAGKMAASLAHEINNPLAAVTNLLYLIGQDDALREDSKRFVHMASSEVARVSHITRNILAFYRETTTPVELDLSELIHSVLELYAPKIRDFHIRVEFRSGDRCRVTGFPGELRQVTSNLVVNAIEAMPEGGRLSVRVQARRNWRTGVSGVRLMIADTGVGIPGEARQHLFEPFFTTKGDKGTGLGLWVSRDIIAKHEGAIRVRSSLKAGRTGTCFSMFLPARCAQMVNRAMRNKTTSSTGD